MKKFIISASAAFLPFVALANGVHEEGENTLGGQFKELWPMTHMGEGHYFAVVLGTILWLSLIYTVYSLIRKIYID